MPISQKLLRAGEQYGTCSTNFDPEISWATIFPQNCRISTLKHTSVRNKWDFGQRKIKGFSGYKCKQWLWIDKMQTRSTLSPIPHRIWIPTWLWIPMFHEAVWSIVHVDTLLWTSKWRMSHFPKLSFFSFPMLFRLVSLFRFVNRRRPLFLSNWWMLKLDFVQKW